MPSDGRKAGLFRHGQPMAHSVRLLKEFVAFLWQIAPERTVLCWMRKAPRDTEPAKRWAAFLSNHREAIAAMDFFTVPTVAFGVLYCFFVISHGRRRILRCNVTKHPSSEWVSQQLREAFPYDAAPKYLIFDRASNFSTEVVSTITSFGIEPKRASFRSPWQNGVAERFVESCRRDLLDHVIVLNECHLKRLIGEYICYYHDDRCPGSGACTIVTTARLEAQHPSGCSIRGKVAGDVCPTRVLQHS